MSMRDVNATVISVEHSARLSSALVSMSSLCKVGLMGRVSDADLLCINV